MKKEPHWSPSGSSRCRAARNVGGTPGHPLRRFTELRGLFTDSTPHAGRIPVHPASEAVLDIAAAIELDAARYRVASSTSSRVELTLADLPQLDLP